MIGRKNIVGWIATAGFWAVLALAAGGMVAMGRAQCRNAAIMAPDFDEAELGAGFWAEVEAFDDGTWKQRHDAYYERIEAERARRKHQ
jgi:hypothetical protein